MKSPHNERGIALVIVLWVGLLVAAIAGAFIVDTRNSTRLARNFLDNAEARALADGGIHLALFELVRSGAETKWRRDGRLYRRVVPGGTLEIAVEDEAGKIDLNNASDELLEGLFRAAGVDGDKASAFVQAIEDIRNDEDSREQLLRSVGIPNDELKTVSDALRSSGQSNLGSGNDPFSTGNTDGRTFYTVDSLGQVPGITPDLYALLLPALTVFGDTKLNFLTSPREALLAIPGVTAEAVDIFLLGRTADDANDPLDAFLVEGRARDFWRKSESAFVTVKVLAQSENGAKFVRVAIVEIATKNDQPFIVKEWREGDAQSIRPVNPAPEENGQLSGGAT